jgi:hypothetical protein
MIAGVMFLTKEPARTVFLWSVAGLLFVGAAVWFSYAHWAEEPIVKEAALVSDAQTH